MLPTVPVRRWSPPVDIGGTTSCACHTPGMALARLFGRRGARRPGGAVGRPMIWFAGASLLAVIALGFTATAILRRQARGEAIRDAEGDHAFGWRWHRRAGAVREVGGRRTRRPGEIRSRHARPGGHGPGGASEALDARRAHRLLGRASAGGPALCARARGDERRARAGRRGRRQRSEPAREPLRAALRQAA